MDIVEELRQDREAGAKRLESEYRAGLLAMARRLCSDLSDADELVNRTFAAVVAGIDDYLEQSAFFGWMCRIMINLNSADRRRRSDRDVTYPGDLPETADDAAHEAIYRDVDASILRDAINTLPKEMKEAIVMHYLMEQPVARIARFLALPVSTVKWRIHCARVELTRRLTSSAKKPGVKAVLLALALSALAAVGAVGVAAIRSAPEPAAEEAEIVFNTKNTEDTEGSLEVFGGSGDSPQGGSEEITENFSTNNEENAMDIQSVKSAAVKMMAAGAMLAATTVSATAIDPLNYDFNMTISPAAGKVTSTISENFPLLVRLSSARQLGFDPAKCGVNGADLRFALADGTLLAHEIDTWNPSGESLVWVNVPSLAADTQVVAYWGVNDPSLAPAVNAADTWPDFIGVWHLGEGAKIVRDSSGNGYDATNIAAVVAGKDPKIGGCVSCSNLFVTGVFDFTDTNAAKPLLDRSKLTVTAWATIDDFDKRNSPTDGYGNAKNARVDIANKLSGWNDGNGGFAFRFFENNGYGEVAAPFFGVTINSGTGGNLDNWNTKTTSSGGNWRYFTYTMDGKAAVKYQNAAVLESATRSHGILGPDVTVPLMFGASDIHSSNGNVNSGLVVVRMDELRIRNGAASAAWVSADYAQQSSDTFLDYGVVKSVFSISPIAAKFTTSAAELESGIEPAVTISNLVAGVELVAGTDYTVAYSNNHSFGVATATATGIGAYAGKTASTTFVIHATKQVTADCSLAADEDWSAFEAVDVGGVTIDLQGHNLAISGLSGYGQAIITDSVGGGELTINVHAGYPVIIDYVQLTGKLTLVKTGSGMLTVSKAGQTFSGGTRIVSGVVKYACSSKNIDDTHPLGYTSATAKGPITIEAGGIFDPGGSLAWGNHTLIINGGMISNTVAAAEIGYGIFNPKTTVNGDFTFAIGGNYGWTVPDLAGHTVTVDIDTGKTLYVSGSTAYSITGGRINIVRGGWLANFSNRPADFHEVDFDCFNAAPDLKGTISVRDFRPQYPNNYGRGSVALNVYGTFTPESRYFYGPTMQDGSTIDLSAKAGSWSVTSELTEGGNPTTTFAAGAKVKIELGDRNFAKGDQVISWTTQPNATFISKGWDLESRADGLYIIGRVGIGTLVILR